MAGPAVGKMWRGRRTAWLIRSSRENQTFPSETSDMIIGPLLDLLEFGGNFFFKQQ